ncbi:hypothetical protein AEAC466_11235 [Asticcacaulis sp. AC466]|uniref:M20/M25/M40 family metallo-hydrolase n=1 Tax=Asticcacaulis sp. AC466 TaxID=1282362 RepID=UPI0003C3E957|nr:M20/M25/M40 family metallo-hydrolase [Asticcacaulis sp. AC466]ESQ83894.1 hypothetical protein AEAC466_11235 [Asticcacaulis sp. AC466]
MRLKPLLPALAVLASTVLALPAIAADTSGTGEPAFRALYKELVETNTAPGEGSCTLAAQRMQARLKAAGYTDADIHLFIPDSAPKDGGIVAVLRGTGSKKKAILLLAHIDVVAAKRSDWTRDPFTLIEEGGYFYGRGTSDDKAQAAIWTDLLIRLKQEGYRPKRDIKMALTCGEETEGVFNGAHWLSTEHKDWIDADFALNEGANGQLDETGRKIALNIEAAEKVYQDFKLETTNPGGHSSRPVPENAIYQMSTALPKIGALEFPVMLNDATRAYFTRMAPIVGGESGAAMLAIVKNPMDSAANAILSKNPQWHSMLRTTCVATLIEGGHALNALPQHVSANVNCRIFPGVSVDDVQAALVRAVADPAVKVSVVEPRSLATPAPALGPDILGPIEKVSAELWPGVPVVPTMTTGATDGIYTSAAGIPTYGVEGLFVDPDEGHIHGLNERVGVQSLMDARRFMYRLVKLYAAQ